MSHHLHFVVRFIPTALFKSIRLRSSGSAGKLAFFVPMLYHEIDASLARWDLKTVPVMRNH